MDSKSLTMFLHLADSLHFGRTSEALNVSASTLSRVVQRLEDELKVDLFLRDNRRVQLTEQGALFQQYAQQQLSQRRLLDEQLRGVEQLAQGRVSLFCSVTAVHSVLSPVLERLRGQFPQIELQLHTGDQADAIDKVADGEVDIAIAALPDKLSPQLGFQALSYSPLQFIAPAVACSVADSVKGVDEQILPQQQADWWAALPFLLPDRGLVKDRCLRWLSGFGIKPNVSAQVNGNEAIVSMVALGLGVAVVPKLVLSDSAHASQVKVISPDIDHQPLAVGLVYRQQDRQVGVVDAFLNCASAS